MNTQKTEPKLLSIGLPTFNGGVRLRAAIESLLAQTYTPFELIISDNASTDETTAIGQSYARQDARVRYVCQSENIGRMNNFLFVLGEARGEFFLWAADDDRWDSRYAETLIAGLESDARYGVAQSSHERIFSDGMLKDRVILTGPLDFNGRSYVYMLKAVLFNTSAHNFFCGVWRSAVLRRLTARSWPACVRWDRVFMAEAALATGFYSVEPVLFFKHKHRIPIKNRHQGDVEQKRHAILFTYHQYLLAFIGRITTSSAIPLRRKFLLVLPWCILLWRERKRLIGLTLRDVRRLIH